VQKALRGLMGTIISVFKLGLEQRDIPELQFVIELQLDAADLLKDDFAKNQR
jgi:hypothetical protein